MENSIAIKQKAFATHARIMANGEILQNTLLEICKDLKAMRDERLYLEFGYDSFENYAEQAVGIKQRQAYSYISTYEKLGEKYIEENANIGITKLELISQISSYERDEFLKDNDVENESVRELKAKVEEYKKQTEQLTFALEEAKADTDASSANDEIAELQSKIDELQKIIDEKEDVDKDAISEDAFNRGKKEAEKQYRNMLNAEKRSKQDEINRAVDNAVNEAIKKENEKAEVLKQENEKLKQQKTSVEEKLAAAEKKAKVTGADPKVTMLKVYFDELQSTASTVISLINEIATTDQTTADKLKAAVISVLQSTANKLRGE